jgi:hypothetical protein
MKKVSLPLVAAAVNDNVHLLTIIVPTVAVAVLILPALLEHQPCAVEEDFCL